MNVDCETTPSRGRVRHAHRRARVAALVVVSLLAAACGSGVASSTPPTLGSVEATPEELALGANPGGDTPLGPDGTDADGTTSQTTATEAAPVVAVDPAVASREPIGPPLSPGSTADQMLEVVADIHGPTLDVAGQMNRLVDFPAIPTAVDTTITEIRADVGESYGGDRFVVTAEVVLVAAGPIGEHLEFYQTEFAELGWVATASTDAGLGPAELRHLSFEIPDSPYDQDDVTLSLSPALDDGRGGASGGGTGPRTRVQLRYVAMIEIDGDGSPRTRLDSWADDLPLPAGYEVTGAAIQTSDLARRSLHYSLALRYDGIDPASIADRLRDRLPSGDYTELQRPSMGQELDNWVYLEHPLFAEARVSPHQFGSDTDPVVTSVNVNARVEF